MPTATINQHLYRATERELRTLALDLCRRKAEPDIMVRALTVALAAMSTAAAVTAQCTVPLSKESKQSVLLFLLKNFDTILDSEEAIIRKKANGRA